MVTYASCFSKRSGVKPELECFDSGHISFAKQLISEGLIEGQRYFNFV